MRLRCVLEPQPAYQWRLALEIEYRLSDAGLRVETTATNLAATRAPFGIGFHPYLTVGRLPSTGHRSSCPPGAVWSPTTTACR